MEQKQIKKYITTLYRFDEYSYYSLEDFVKEMQEVFLSYKELQGNFVFQFDSEEGFSIRLYEERLETPIEAQAREEREAHSRNYNRIYKLQQFENLKKELGL